MTTRILPPAADALRAAIRENGGREVFAIGDVVDGHVTDLTVTCRGQADRVTALLDRPNAGQVVIHNHPSNDLTPSDADLSLASFYGEMGVGVVIVDNFVQSANWVVEPYVKREAPVDDDALERFFTDGLNRAMPDREARPQQLALAREVAAALSGNHTLVSEAGTGTGKSLAYLVPAALWAQANDRKVMVSTHTLALQAQLVASDLPLLLKGGLDVSYAVLQGRNNYLCKRRLGIASGEADSVDGDERDHELLNTLSALREWDATTADGSRSDLAFSVDSSTWDQVLSDSDLSLSTRCPYYADCHYYAARRRASGAQIVVVNHALLLIDLMLKAETGRGVLPKYDRLILDEAHHLEDAATGVVSSALTAIAVRRAVFPLLDRGKRKGALSRLLDAERSQPALPTSAEGALREQLVLGEARARAAADQVPAALGVLADAVLADDLAHLRLDEAACQRAAWREVGAPVTVEVAEQLDEAATALADVADQFEQTQPSVAHAQPLAEVRRAARRLAAHAATANRLLEPPGDPDHCRWVERTPTRNERPAASLHAAPVDVAATLRTILWNALPGTVCTSATLAVGGKFTFFRAQVGLFGDEAIREALFPSPFDHFNQAMLGLPRDLPPPDDARFMHASGQAIVDALRVSDGGAFVLCTSYSAVRTYAAAIRAALPNFPVLVHGEVPRERLIERFRSSNRAILIGTDSFWEGVSIKGERLRLVVIPRLPFRVPTEPLRQARHERISQRGGDPFRQLTVPETALKLKQGYGRLLRSYNDRGAVVILDSRILDKRYGQVLLAALPPARRVKGAWSDVLNALRQFMPPAAGGVAATQEP